MDARERAVSLVDKHRKLGRPLDYADVEEAIRQAESDAAREARRAALLDAATWLEENVATAKRIREKDGKRDDLYENFADRKQLDVADALRSLASTKEQG